MIEPFSLATDAGSLLALSSILAVLQKGAGFFQQEHIPRGNAASRAFWWEFLFWLLHCLIWTLVGMRMHNCWQSCQP